MTYPEKVRHFYRWRRILLFAFLVAATTVLIAVALREPPRAVYLLGFASGAAWTLIWFAFLETMRYPLQPEDLPK